MLKRHKESHWVVIVSRLIADEKDQTKMLARDYAMEVKAHTAESACWRACKSIWMNAAKQKEAMPIFNVKAMTKDRYDEAVRLTKEEEQKKKDAEPVVINSPVYSPAPTGDAPIVELPKPEVSDV